MHKKRHKTALHMHYKDTKKGQIYQTFQKKIRLIQTTSSEASNLECAGGEVHDGLAVQLERLL